jgi:hypothetical protein
VERITKLCIGDIGADLVEQKRLQQRSLFCGRGWIWQPCRQGPGHAGIEQVEFWMGYRCSTAARPANRLVPPLRSFRALEPDKMKFNFRVSIRRCTSSSRAGTEWR